MGNLSWKTSSSSTMAIMDKIGGWEEEYWVGSRFATSMWIYTKEAICNGQNNMNGVCDDALDDHVWVYKLTISCQKSRVLEALQDDFAANPWMVQWGMLWLSAPTKLNRIFLNKVILENYNEAICLAFQSAVTLPFSRMNTPRSCFLRSTRIVLCRSLERDWDVNREMRGWRLGERPPMNESGEIL